MKKKRRNNKAVTYIKQDRMLRPAKILVVLDAPLKVELDRGKAFSAPSLKSGLMMPMKNAGIARSDVQLTYLTNFAADFPSLFYTEKSISGLDFKKLPDHKDLYVKNFFASAISRLKTEIELVKPNVVVCAGKWSLLLLTGETTLLETVRSNYGALLRWRGSHLSLLPFIRSSSNPIVIPVLPPSSMFMLGEAKLYAITDYARIKYCSQNPDKYRKPDWNLIVPTTFKEAYNQLEALLLTLEKSKKPLQVSVDIETERGYMDCLAFTLDGKNSTTIVLEGEDSHTWTFEQEVQLTQLMFLILQHKNTEIVGQNFSYDMQYFFRFWCLDILPAHDTIIKQHVLSPAMKKDLATLSSMYCIYHKYWKDEGKLKLGASRDDRYKYNGKDVCITWEISSLLDKVYRQRPALKSPLEFQTKHSLPTATRLMYRGVTVDLKERKRVTAQVEDILRQMEGIFAQVGLGGINFSSPKQLADLFYNVLQATPQYNDNGGLTTGKEALRTIKNEDILYEPIVDLLELYRSYSVLLKTFLRAELDIDNKLRCFYSVTGTDTYRYASKKSAFNKGLNLQNIPPEKELAFGMKLPSIKKLIIPSSPLKEISDADLGSADARIVMAECGSQFMKDIFDSGDDLYATLAGEYHKRPILYKDNKKDKIIRQQFKGIIHATHYLGYPAGIAARTGLLQADISRVQKWYFEVNPEVLDYHRRIKGWVDFRGYIENIFGFRYYFINKRATAYQQAAAWIPQSTIALLINKAMTKVDESYDNIDVLLQVHDSFVSEYLISERDECQEKILDALRIPLQYPSMELTIPADIKTSSKSWGHCE